MVLSAKAMNTITDALDRCTVDQLLTLNRSINARHKVLARMADAEMLGQIQRGSKVRVKYGSGIRPQYIQGLSGTIEEFRTTRVVMKLDRGPVGKFKSGRIVGSPGLFEMIEVL